MVFQLTFIHSEGSGKPAKETYKKSWDTVKLLHDFTLTF